ncbi:MAG TPA: hypothetical protein VK770_03690 [Candidatus Acidoferrum sp.]|jgi:hypothetical protein|nr:hypothetical protein [Candidatus Acidoferrum sp.]
MSEMTCREFDEIVHGFVRMELLDVNVREAALEHAAHCELCSERMADAAALAEASELMGRSARGEQTPAHVEALLLAAFGSHHRRASWRRTLEWASVGAAAAVLIIFLWTGTGGSRGQSRTSPRKVVSSESKQPVEAKVAASPALVESIQDAEVEIPDTSTSEAFVASDFVPVPFTAGIGPDDPGMVVRVQLTRASLTELGYPIAESPDEDLILADVLVGEDGWPRAVKLVQ